MQCCSPVDPQANDDADFKNPPPQKKLKLTVGKGRRKLPRNVISVHAVQANWRLRVRDNLYAKK